MYVLMISVSPPLSCLVHKAPSYLSLISSSSGLASKMFPEVLGVYRLSHTTMDSHHLFGDESNWLVKIERHNGVIEYVENPNLILVSMENRMEHGIRMLLNMSFMRSVF